MQNYSVVLKKILPALTCSYITERWCQTENGSLQTKCLTSLCASGRPLCFPLSALPTITLLGAIFRSEIEKLCCEMEKESTSCHRGFNLVSKGNDSTEGVSACCHGLEGLGGLAANLRGGYLCYSQIIPLSAVLLPPFRCAEVRLAWVDTGDAIPVWKKVELHLLACLG